MNLDSTQNTAESKMMRKYLRLITKVSNIGSMSDNGCVMPINVAHITVKEF